MKLKKLALVAALGMTYLSAPLLIQAEVLDAGEEAHLIFMREEEKLARDVYMTLGALYPDQQVFTKIGDNSEQTHTDRARDTLAYYNIADPNPETNNLPDSIGVFTGADYGEFFNDTFTWLAEDWGSLSVLDALYVGAFIEELDMHDIVDCPHVIVVTDPDVDEGECGLEYTDEKKLQRVLTNLLEGSKDHLRAFVKNIEMIIGEGEYKAQVLTDEEVDDILGR